MWLKSGSMHRANRHTHCAYMPERARWRVISFARVAVMKALNWNYLSRLNSSGDTFESVCRLKWSDYYLAVSCKGNNRSVNVFLKGQQRSAALDLVAVSIRSPPVYVSANICVHTCFDVAQLHVPHRTPPMQMVIRQEESHFACKSCGHEGTEFALFVTLLLQREHLLISMLTAVIILQSGSQE